MGNLCSNDEQRIEHLEAKIDEQSSQIESLLYNKRLLERENRYLQKMRTQNFKIHS